MSNVTIRAAGIDGTEWILNFIKQLAAHQNLAEKVKTNIEQL